MDWTTFFLEIINFLILAWLLKRLLYKPVLNIIKKRQQTIEKEISNANAIKVEAQAVKEQYENRVSHWQQECEVAREQLHKEIENERILRKEALTTELDQDREQSKVLNERHLQEVRTDIENIALKQASAFATRLLCRLASPDLEGLIVNMVLEDLSTISQDKLDELHNSWSNNQQKIVYVSSAFELDQVLKSRLQHCFSQLLKIEELAVKFKQDQTLLAGITIIIGPWAIHANLKDELAFFSEVSNGQTR